ncbi:hypothetical protein ACFL4K_00760 [Candidatus Neomarinimicrobiota bacterium]
MEKNRDVLGENLGVSLSPDFVPHLQARLRAEINRPPSLWQQVLAPRIGGFSPISLSGLAAATLALFIIGVSLFNQESAPLVSPPQGSMQSGSPTRTLPNPTGKLQTASPLLTTTPDDSVMNERDSSQRDFSRQIRYVDQPQRD